MQRRNAQLQRNSYNPLKSAVSEPNFEQITEIIRRRNILSKEKCLNSTSSETDKVEDSKLAQSFSAAISVTRSSSSEESSSSNCDEFANNKSINSGVTITKKELLRTESNADKSPNLFLNPEIIARLRRYSETWFRRYNIPNILSTQNNMRILKERITNVAQKGVITASFNKVNCELDEDAKPITLLPGQDEYSDDDNDTTNYLPNFQRLPNAHPLIGFDPETTSFLGGGDRIITIASGERFLCYINARECADELTMFDFRAPISAILVAHNYRFLVICIDHKQQGSTIIVKDSSTFDTIVSFPVRVLAKQMCISLNNRVLLLFAPHSGGLSATICTYATMEGTLIAEAKIVSSVHTQNWEISFCPADEDIVCLLADDHVNLMRSTSNQISVFSTHRIIGVTCHTWADDVTQAFGTKDGKIILYRETVALETIELKGLHSKLISEVRDSPTAAVVKMFSCEFGMLVCVEAGVIFFFPPTTTKQGNAFSDDEEGSRWKNSKAIVINSLTRNLRCLRLHLDESGGNILYADAEGIYTCNVSYSETVCKEGMRPIMLRHATAVTHIAVDVNSNVVATSDKSDLILVTSANTGKVLACSTASGVIALAILPGGYKILIVTRSELVIFGVLYQKLVKIAKIEGCGSGLQAVSADPANKLLAVVCKSQLLIFRMDSLDKALESFCGTKQEIIQLKWSLDSVFIGILTDRDTVCLIEAETGSVLWTTEFKLRFFVDLSIVDVNNVYVMGNKFMMSRLNGGRETESVTVHHEGINFKENSTVLVSTNRLNFVGTSTGGMIRVDNENFEKNMLLNCRQTSSITTITHNKGTDQLYVGFEDGQIVCFNIFDESDSQLAASAGLNDEDNCQLNQDFVLCPVEEIVRYKTIIRELNAERNMIREQGEQILGEYRKRKENEIHQLNEQLERIAQETREKMRKADEKFEAIEATKEEAFAKMKLAMKEEVLAQKSQYEKMLNDQIKMSLEKEEKRRTTNEEKNNEYDSKITEMERASKDLESKWRRQSQRLQERVEELSERLRHKEMQLEKAHAEKRSTEISHINALKASHAQYAQERKDQIDASKQLKAYILRLKEENQSLRNNLEEVREKFHGAHDELEDCRVQLDNKTRVVGEEANKSSELERRLEIKKNECAVLTQKFKILQSEVDQEKAARMTSQRRLREFDTLVSEMADHIYDGRRLEQSVLGLLAFFNSTKVPVLNRAAVTVALRQNNPAPVAPTRKSLQQSSSKAYKDKTKHK